jgi:hypothetical protein
LSIIYMNLSTLPAFQWPSFEGARLLLVGIGGGSDIITAFALGQSLSTSAERIYANTKTNAEPDWNLLSAHIARLPPKKGISERLASGGTSIDRLLPKGARECPWIFLLKKGEEDALLQEMQAQQFSHVIAVDTGGDVLSTRGKAGRDQRMYALLQRLNLPLWLMVIAPGSDGQSTRERMSNDLQRAVEQDNFQGAFALDSLLPIFSQYGPLLPAVKTPNLILSAYRTTTESIQIPRGNKPTLPTHWLRTGLVFHNASKMTDKPAVHLDNSESNADKPVVPESGKLPSR